MSWYRREPAAFIQGTVGLTFEEKGAYSIVLDLIYANNGPIADDARFIAGVCNLSVRKWNALRDSLIARGKLTASEGRLSNARAEKEIEKARIISENHGINGAKGGNKSAEIKANANKNNGIDQAGLKHTRAVTNTNTKDKEESSLRSLSSQAEPEQPDCFPEFWATYPKRLGTNSRKDAEARFARLTKSGVPPGSIIEGAARYAAHCDATAKTGTEFVQQATTWLNQRGWETEYGRPDRVPARQERSAERSNPLLAHLAERLHDLDERERASDPSQAAGYRASSRFADAYQDDFGGFGGWSDRAPCDPDRGQIAIDAAPAGRRGFR